MTPIQGKATKPLRLPHKAPRCFSQRQWNAYRPLAQYSAGNGFTYCSDCNPEHKAEMIAGGRCAFQGTTFRKLASGIIIGRRKK
jgi:hypothetical protein